MKTDITHRGYDNIPSLCNKDGFIECAQHNFNILNSIDFVYCTGESFTVDFTVAIFRIYPKDKNPRRHLRDLLPKNN